MNTVKQFYQEYTPTEEDNLELIRILTKPDVYETLKLLRTAIVTRDDLEKLKKKNVDDPSEVLKMLWDTHVIHVLVDKSGNEYFALLSDFYIDTIFPKYLLNIIKERYEQKSKGDKELIEYLNILEDIYLNIIKQETPRE